MRRKHHNFFLEEGTGIVGEFFFRLGRLIRIVAKVYASLQVGVQPASSELLVLKQDRNKKGGRGVKSSASLNYILITRFAYGLLKRKNMFGSVDMVFVKGEVAPVGVHGPSTFVACCNEPPVQLSTN